MLYICAQMNEVLYIQSATSLLEKIARYDAIILALEGQALLAAADISIEEYSLDDGQVKIKTLYRDMISITGAIVNFESLKGKALNKLNGASFILKSRRGLQ